MHQSYFNQHTRWMLACQKPFERFKQAIGQSRRVQEDMLKAICRQNEDTVFGREHSFKSVGSINDFRKYVPISDYADFEPYIRRVRQGEVNVLTSERITHLHLTSGTTKGSKLLPFTEGLCGGFQAGIQPWLYDLYTRYPNLKQGKFYWVVTPPGMPSSSIESVVPVGFADDADYLDPVGKSVFPEISAGCTVSTLSEIDPGQFYGEIWTSLLANPSLSMISFWSPRFFAELLRNLPFCAESVLRQIHRTDKSRTNELQRVFDSGLDAIGLGRCLWPNLNLVSCWTDGWAALFLQEIQQFFDGVYIQGKGLLATEGIISFPWGDETGSVLAVCSHFFEFESEAGDLLLSHELIEGKEYKIVLTTQGGLYRYQLGDVIRVTGWEGNIPRMQFVSRTGCVVDLCGEKMDEAHVSRILSQALRRRQRSPMICFLAPEITNESAGYVLVLDESYRDNPLGLCDEVECGLQENVYYKHGRQLGQLSPLRIRRLNSSGVERYMLASGHISTMKLSLLQTKLDTAYLSKA